MTGRGTGEGGRRGDGCLGEAMEKDRAGGALEQGHRPDLLQTSNERQSAYLLGAKSLT